MLRGATKAMRHLTGDGLDSLTLRHCHTGAHLKEARALGTYFAACIDHHNARVRELQDEVDEKCGASKPED